MIPSDLGYTFHTMCYNPELFKPETIESIRVAFEENFDFWEHLLDEDYYIIINTSEAREKYKLPRAGHLSYHVIKHKGGYKISCIGMNGYEYGYILYQKD